MKYIFVPFYTLFVLTLSAQYTKADSLRGSLNVNRTWWDVQHYDLTIKPNITEKSIDGVNVITFKVSSDLQSKMQIDLQKPMLLDSVILNDKKMNFSSEFNTYLVDNNQKLAKNTTQKITLYFHGNPKEAINAPWDGGLVWAMDKNNKPWIATACQGIGASVWWPNKDHLSDEPDDGAKINIITDDSLVAISNGKLIGIQKLTANKNKYSYEVKNPINNYAITMNIGNYDIYTDYYQGINGNLPLQFCFLKNDLLQAKTALVHQTKLMLKTFEHWFGAYPFYSDGYKLIQTPFLGMEHQSAVAYGNQLKKGYFGTDLSGTGWGMKWDFILVHESGHEWFGNSITNQDIADMWIQEGFTSYSEVLYVESNFGKKAAEEYLVGLRKKIVNDKPIIGNYGVNKEGSADMYFKGAQLVHIYRQVIDDDDKFRMILHTMNKQFKLKTITTQIVEDFLQSYCQLQLKPIFDTYLRSTKIPKLIYKFETTKGKEKYLMTKWDSVVDNFKLPITFKYGKKTYKKLITDSWVMTDIKYKVGEDSIKLNPNYYVEIAKMKLDN